jgi:DNA-binding XRE family transcriptional regulator
MHDLLHIDGKPFVLVPMHEYRRLVNGGAETRSGLPDSILDRLATGADHPVKTLRKFRGLTQAELAQAARLSRQSPTEIPPLKKHGSLTALQSLASALNVEPGILLKNA